jgi:hypothetical protein
MEDCAFFREEADRCRSQSRDSSDLMVQATLDILAAGFAEYAEGLEKRKVEALQPLLNQEAVGGHDANVNLPLEDCPGEDETETVSGPIGSSMRAISFGVLLLTPGVGTLIWTLWNNGPRFW